MVTSDVYVTTEIYVNGCRHATWDAENGVLIQEERKIVSC
jgi:hypothetical protein